MGGRGLHRGCRRVVLPLGMGVPRVGAARSLPRFLPGNSSGCRRGLLELVGRCLAGVCCSTGSLSFRCACTCVRALRLREIMLHNFPFLSLLT